MYNAGGDWAQGQQAGGDPGAPSADSFRMELEALLRRESSSHGTHVTAAQHVYIKYKNTKI